MTNTSPPWPDLLNLNTGGGDGGDCTDCDERFVNATGDVMTGSLTLADGSVIVDSGGLFVKEGIDFQGDLNQRSGSSATLGQLHVQQRAEFLDDVVLDRDPDQPMEAATKQYVDAKAATPGPPGPEGPPGPPGANTTLFEYNYATGLTPPPSAGTLRSNTDTAVTTTLVWVHRLDITTADRKPLLMTGRAGSVLYVQDIDNAANYVQSTLTADPVDSGDYITFAVTYKEGAGGLTGNMRCLVGVLAGAPKSAYTHVQSVAATTWDIIHDLGFQPNVTITDSAGDRVEGDITYVSASTVRLTFSAAFSGIAYLS